MKSFLSLGKDENDMQGAEASDDASVPSAETETECNENANRSISLLSFPFSASIPTSCTDS